MKPPNGICSCTSLAVSNTTNGLFVFISTDSVTNKSLCKNIFIT